MYGDVPILTDYGFARLEISRLQIDFGSTTYGRAGSIEAFLSKKVSEAVAGFLESHQFALAVCDKKEHSVCFTLSAIGAPLRELTCSSHFETSWLTFNRAMETSHSSGTAPQDVSEEKVA